MHDTSKTNIERNFKWTWLSLLSFLPLVPLRQFSFCFSHSPGLELHEQTELMFSAAGRVYIICLWVGGLL